MTNQINKLITIKQLPTIAPINRLKNGMWYHVDLTWDLFAKALHGKYSWFMLTEKEITKDHTIDRRL